MTYLAAAWAATPNESHSLTGSHVLPGSNGWNGGIVGYMIVAFAVLVLIVGSAVVTLIRRDRRRVYDSPDSARIEARATRSLRDARGRAHAAQHLSDSGAVSAARDRDPGIGSL